MTSDQSQAPYDIVVVGANRAGLALAAEAADGGATRVIVIESTEATDLAEVPDGMAVEFGSRVAAIRSNGAVTVSRTGGALNTRVAVVASRQERLSAPPNYPIPAGVAERVHFELPDDLPDDADVLVIGVGETAAEYAETLVERGQPHVVVSFPPAAFDRLSAPTRERLLELEKGARVTVFWNAQPTALVDSEGFPLVEFSDRRTPDLVFDHIVYALGSGDPTGRFARLGIELEAGSAEPSIYVLTDGVPTTTLPGTRFVGPGNAWRVIRERHFPELAPPPDLTSRPTLIRAGLAANLREKHYNATITSFENHHSDLWILRVRPDVGDASHEPGQYATLALGYWEPRLDGLDEGLDEAKIEKLARRSYSISHPMLSSDGRLLGPGDFDGVEFYIVLVRPEGMEHLPELTPRLALKDVGDRIFMGPKVAGRYTLKNVTDPDQDVVFLATGTGEAPHNNMLAELLRRGHTGRIVSACTVRYQRDLAYLSTHRRLEEMYPNYRYVALTTREADTINNKVYIQDMITNGMLAEALGHEPIPGRTEFYLCGNPAMIGLPEDWGDGDPKWPSPRGVCEILTGLGFTVERRGVPGNVHYEEYW